MVTLGATGVKQFFAQGDTFLSHGVVSGDVVDSGKEKGFGQFVWRWLIRLFSLRLAGKERRQRKNAENCDTFHKLSLIFERVPLRFSKVMKWGLGAALCSSSTVVFKGEFISSLVLMLNTSFPFSLSIC